MFGYIYKTVIKDKTSALHNHFYIGQKKSPKIIEDYYGSGTLIRRYIKKHGKSCLKRTILKRCFSIESLNSSEYKFVKPHLNNAKCLNLVSGGLQPGFSEKLLHKMSKSQKKSLRKGTEVYNARLGRSFFTNGTDNTLSHNCPDGWYKGRITKNGYKDRGPSSDSTKRKLSKAHKGLIRTAEHIENNRQSLLRYLSTDKGRKMHNKKLKLARESRTKESFRKQSNSLKKLYASKEGELLKQKLRNAVLGKKWFNNGEKQIMAYKKPRGYKHGRL